MQPRRDNNTTHQEIHLLLGEMLAMIDCVSQREIQQFALEAMTRLTDSPLGYICAIDSQSGTICLENIVPDNQSAILAGSTRVEEFSGPGPWHDCQAKNTPQLCRTTDLNVPSLGLISEGLAVPVRRHDEVVAVIGVGNRPAPYLDREREVLRELATALGRVVVRKHLHDSMPDDVK